MLMALWVIAGCFFVTLNASAFFAIFENPIPEPSREVKTARLKYGQFDLLLENKSGVIDEESWQIFRRRFGKRLTDNKRVYPSKQKKKRDHVVYEEVNLPVLSGIVTISSDGLETIYLAVLNGKTGSENSEIDGFRVEKITEEKVFIQRKGRQWVLDAPNVKYSVSHAQ